MMEDFWTPRRFMTMNLETAREIDIFKEIAAGRTSDDTPLVGIAMVGAAEHTGDLEEWARRQIDRGMFLRARLMPWHECQPDEDLEDLNVVKTHEKLNSVFQRAQEAQEEYCLLRLQTGRRSLPEGLEDLWETAREFLRMEAARMEAMRLEDMGLGAHEGPDEWSNEPVLQACLVNLPDMAEAPDGTRFPVCGESLEIVLMVRRPGTPNILEMMDRDEYMQLKDLMGENIPGMTEHEIPRPHLEEYVELNQN